MHSLAVALALLAASQAPTRAPAAPAAPATGAAQGTTAGRGPEASAPPVAEGPLPPGWSERQSREGAFAALMPCEPRPLGEPVDLPSDKGDLRMLVWGCEVAKGSGYGVVVLEFPPAASAELTADALDRLAEQMAQRSAGKGARFGRAVRRTVAGAPARDFTLEKDGKQLRFLMVLDGRRLLQAVASREGGETIPGSERFYDSFRPLR
jgi:hypothetical protein